MVVFQPHIKHIITTNLIDTSSEDARTFTFISEKQKPLHNDESIKKNEIH